MEANSGISSSAPSSCAIMTVVDSGTENIRDTPDTYDGPCCAHSQDKSQGAGQYNAYLCQRCMIVCWIAQKAFTASARGVGSLCSTVVTISGAVDGSNPVN